MSYRKIILLLVLPLMISSKLSKVDKKRLQLSKPIKDCKQISCPAVEDPICVKLKYQKPELANVTTYVSMINKCEMGYMKCHKDIEFFVVPMKHCDHKHVTSNKNIAKKRIKREATKESNTNIVDETPQPGELKTFKKIAKPLPPKKSYSALLNFYNKKMNTTGKKKSFRRNIEDGQLNDDVGDIQENTQKNESTAVTPVTMYGETTENVKKYDTDSDDIPTTKEPKDDNEESDEESDSKNVPENSSEESNEKEKQNQQHPVKNDDDDGNNDGDGDNGDDQDRNVMSKPAECPKSCPARPVMVCAKCQHGVYKTFMSTCHVRMFACNNEDEEMELVSRYPCIMSSAYLASTPGMNLEPKGREDEDGDVDKVLRFIICREKGKINVDNSDEDENAGPRCNITE